MKRLIISLSCFLILFSSCQKHDLQLERALTLAKENRSELEKVLAFYERDSLKLEAAKFLIRNMPGHYSYREIDVINKYYDAVDSILKNVRRSREEMRDTLEKVSLQIIRNIHTVPDIEIIKSDYLIANIDKAFLQWKEGEWTAHLSFQDFCEYLLPYKAVELQPFDNWRDSAKNRYNKGLDELQYCDAYKGSAVWAAHRINNQLREVVQPYLLDYNMHPIHRLSTKTKLPFGVCEDYVEMATSIMRSSGIPVMMDFTPQWPFLDLGHSWNILLANNGKNIPFSGAESNPGEPHKLGEKMAKVYRRTYAHNAEMHDLLASEEFIPETFRTPFIKDVTTEYMSTCDVEIEVENVDSKYVYLAVFNRPSWIPIAFTKINNNKAEFKRLGKNVLYLPVCYAKYGINPVGDPFIITSEGEMKPLTPDNRALQSMTLYRKYPLFRHVQDIAYRIVGAKFQAANKPNFEDTVTIHKIEKWGTRGEEINIPSLERKYRYWRLYQPEWSHCNVAEITFIERDSHLRNQGKIIGLERSWNNDPNTYKEAAFDGDLLTFFDSALPAGGWVGMDFGHPVDIERILYTPRGDGNTNGIGDEYELFYWTEHRWVSLGKQIATTIKLEYDEVPSGGLYFLRNLTKGKEERIFTYENGEQVFW